MKSLTGILAVMLALLAGCGADGESLAAPDTFDEFPEAFHTEANRIVDAAGNRVVLHGVNALDPLAQTTFGEPSMGIWGKDYYAVMAEWGVQLVRIPVHPQLWHDDPAQSLETLDQTVDWIAELGMYAIIDYHSIGMATTGVFEDPIYATTTQGLEDFWLTIASHFNQNDVVAFYELFNEPVNLVRAEAEGANNADDWHDWKLLAESVVDVVRTEDPDTPIIVGGMYWSSDLSHVNDDPVERDNIIYAVHPYPGSADHLPWVTAFGETAKNYPILATEIGFTDVNTRANIGSTFPEMSDGEDSDYLNPTYLESSYTQGLYREDVTTFLADRDIGWTAWSFSPIWGPVLLESWDYEPTDAGRFFKSQF